MLMRRNSLEQCRVGVIALLFVWHIASLLYGKHETKQQHIIKEQSKTLWKSCPHLVLQSDAEQRANQNARICKAKRSSVKQYTTMQAIQRNAKQSNADQSNAKRWKANQHITVAILAECGRLPAATCMFTELLRVAWRLPPSFIVVQKRYPCCHGHRNIVVSVSQCKTTDQNVLG